MKLSGYQPRLYINALPHKWTDTEVTMYYQRKVDENLAYAGGVIGVGSGLKGHTTSAPCTATTYYSLLRHDGAFQFAKELKHPTASKRSISSNIWGGGSLPKLKWIGIKTITYTLNKTVVLETYRDMSGGAAGGSWQLLGRTVDSGGWIAAHNCSYPADYVVTQGGGVVFVRNTKVSDAVYKWMSVRELP